jgi:hypothetical protein
MIDLLFGAVGARHLGGDEAVVLEEVQVAPRELGKIVRLARLAANRAREQAAALGGDLQVQFVRLFVGIKLLANQPPRRRNPQPQSQNRIRVHLSPGRLNLRQRASVLVTVKDASRRCAMALRPSLTVTARADRACAGRDERMVVGQSNQRMTRWQPMPLHMGIPSSEIHLARRGGLKRVLRYSKASHPTADGEGFFGVSPDHNASIEVLPYSKMLHDAKIRNEAFFRQLGLD